MKKPAVFLDRDGTINEQMGYVNHLTRFVVLSGVTEGIRLLNGHGFHVVVVTNQSGVARGYFPIGLVHEIHDFMKAYFRKNRAAVDGIFFCPHHPGGSVPEYATQCNCRKPKIGLVEQACNHMDIDLPRSYVIGDRCDDIELAERAGMKGILVKTGYGLGEIDHVLPLRALKPAHIAEDLFHAARWIIDEERASPQK
jgi:D-glycero-D-manno-heptose 1,7-bisphosphate phosphatase